MGYDIFKEFLGKWSVLTEVLRKSCYISVMYSSDPNKRAGPNKRAEWNFDKKIRNVCRLLIILKVYQISFLSEVISEKERALLSKLEAIFLTHFSEKNETY